MSGSASAGEGYPARGGHPAGVAKQVDAPALEAGGVEVV